ncbi:hypothetical protein SAMN04487911_10381 [Arenibacter nanhaiticus]|uniref:Uncharacterized protein n=1 Tax=Arenibacter nanhaiticus TaxID=558155 RepID=A0A1M6C4N8_9FLAO|nr:hypothetical protein SAMN04487911_10381 [Arenibacter nanhaiticus]
MGLKFINNNSGLLQVQRGSRGIVALRTLGDLSYTIAYLKKEVGSRNNNVDPDPCLPDALRAF